MARSKFFFTKFKRKFLSHLWLARIIIILGVLCVVFLGVVGIASVVKKPPLSDYIDIVTAFVFSPKDKVKNFDGRTNILILGKGGEGHEAPDLTDTIIFASINHKKPSIDLISLPRDIWITDLRTKLNSVYYWGNKKQSDGGIVLAKASVEEIVGQPVHYALLVDFSGFK